MILWDVVFTRLANKAKEKGITLAKLEELAGYSEGYLSKAKKRNYKSSPDINKLIFAAQYLGVSLDALFAEEYKRKIVNEEDLLVEYLQEIKRLTDADQMTWYYEAWEETLTKCYEEQDLQLTNPGMRMEFTHEPEEPIKWFYAVDEDDPKEIRGEYYAKIPGTEEYIVIVDLDYFEEEAQNVFIASELVLTPRSPYVNASIWESAGNLFDSVVTQWKSNNGTISRELRDKLSGQLKLLKEIPSAKSE